jgi:hypothetical protein
VNLFGQEKGFDFGFNVSIIQRSNSITLANNASFDKISSSRGFGFDMGFNFYCVFTERFELRANPCAGFEEDELKYTKSGSTETILFEPTFFKLPIHGIVKMSKRIPIGIVIGVTPNFQVSQGPKDPVDKLKLKGNELTADIGLNYPIRLPWFVLQPEIRYSKSLVNSAGDNRTVYGQAITDFYRNRFTIGIYIRKPK